MSHAGSSNRSSARYWLRIRRARMSLRTSAAVVAEGGGATGAFLFAGQPGEHARNPGNLFVELAELRRLAVAGGIVDAARRERRECYREGGGTLRDRGCTQQLDARTELR